jgi:hypothetical protein
LIEEFERFGRDPERVREYRDSKEFKEAKKKPGRNNRDCKISYFSELWCIPGDSCMLACINQFFGLLIAPDLAYLAKNVLQKSNSSAFSKGEIQIDLVSGEPTNLLMKFYNRLAVNTAPNCQDVSCQREDVLRKNIHWNSEQSRKAITEAMNKCLENRMSDGRNVGNAW